MHLFAAVPLTVPWWGWAAFLGVVGVLLVVDLAVVHRRRPDPTLRAAVVESLVWIAFGLGFAGVVLAVGGAGAAGEYLSAYLLEKGLSVDNVVVWAVVLAWFGIDRRHQRQVLFWGIFGAVVLRGGFILAGAALLGRFEWVGYVFGVVLIVTAVRLFVAEETGFDPGRSLAVRWLGRAVPIHHGPHDGRFVVRVDGRRAATVLLLALLVVEVTDVVFAVDSVPAVLSVSNSAFIAFTSNVMAILGLRALYFVLADLRERFHYLEEGIAVVLALVGIGVVLELGVPGLGRVELPTWATLAMIVVVLAGAALISWWRPPPERTDADVS